MYSFTVRTLSGIAGPAACAASPRAPAPSSTARREIIRAMLYEACTLLVSPMVEALIPAVLLVQGVLGGFDTLFNHDFVEQLAKRPEARPEIGLHALRE